MYACMYAMYVVYVCMYVMYVCILGTTFVIRGLGCLMLARGQGLGPNITLAPGALAARELLVYRTAATHRGGLNSFTTRRSHIPRKGIVSYTSKIPVNDIGSYILKPDLKRHR